MMKTLHMALAASLLALTACGNRVKVTTPEPEGPVAWMESNASNYLEDRQWRRDTLEATMWRPDLPYAQKLLDNYGLERGGWDLLPVLDFQVAPVPAEGTDGPFKGTSLMSARPETLAQWLELGEEAFWSMPMRRDPYIEWIANQPEHWEEVGLEQNADGSLRGFVRYIDPRGRARVGISCGLCHGAGGEAGRANTKVDLGKARAMYMEWRGLDPAPFDSWGAGKLDVTNDNINDPVSIPNLWGASEQAYFNASGSVKVATPASAAVRFETQYIINHSYEARPDRALPWALAMYVMSLELPEENTPLSESARAGERVFAKQCASCHVPERGMSGDLIPASVLESDPRIAHSVTRGTGSYRVPSLQGISRGGPYLHDSSAASLDELLTRGHPLGEPLSTAEQADLLAYLNTL